MLERLLIRSGKFLRSLLVGKHRTLRFAALGAQLIFAVALVSHPRLVFPFLPALVGGCTFCPAKAVTTISYRSSQPGKSTYLAPVCAEHAQTAPAKYSPRLQSLDNFWLLAPLFIFYCFLLFLLVASALGVLATLENCAASLHAWPALLVLLTGILMIFIVELHARQLLIVTLFGEQFDAARWLFWLALPLTTFVVWVVSIAFSAAAARPGTGREPPQAA